MADPVNLWNPQSHEANRTASLRRAIIGVLQAHGYTIAIRTIIADTVWSVEAYCGSMWVTVVQENEDEKDKQQKTNSSSDRSRLTITSE